MRKNRKKRGFTLLEIIIVIIIIGVLATLGFTQYGRMVERSRGAEARSVCGDIRKFAQAHYLEYGSLIGVTPFSNTLANIGPAVDQIPSACRSSHYFMYTTVNTAANVVTITATRCGATGKAPAGTGGTYIMVSDLAAGTDDVDNGNGGY